MKKSVIIHCGNYSDAMLLYDYFTTHGKNVNFDIDFCLAQYGSELCYKIIDDEVLCNTYDYFVLKQNGDEILEAEDCSDEFLEEI